MAYLLDADVLIRAKNDHYGFDICPAFWEWIEKQHAAGNVRSVEKVGDELLAGADELATWAKERGAGFFVPPSSDDVEALRLVSAWPRPPRYDPIARSTFLDRADYYLVAQALAGKHVVVTHEVPSTSPKKIKIPDACIGVGLKYMTPFKMLQRESARFVLPK